MGTDAEDQAPKLAGQAVLDTRRAFEALLGPETVARALASLPPRIREEYEHATSISWVPYEVMHEVHEAFAREAGRPAEELLDQVIPMAIERSFATVWRVFLRFTGDEAIVRRAASIYARTRSRGTMTARLVGPGRGVAEVTGWASIPPRDVRALGVSIAAFLRLAGRTNVAVQGEKTAAGARWQIRFDA